MRLFIAVNFDDTTTEKIIQVQEALRTHGTGRFAYRDNLHLTLAFLGEISPKQLGQIETAMAATPVQSWELVFDRVGSFSRDGGDIWWLGIRENPSLVVTQKSLCQNLTRAGFTIESRGFTPHITLARQVKLQTEPAEGDLLPQAFATRANKISLMLSERINGRLKYTELFTVTEK